MIKGRLFHGLHYVSLLRFEFPHGKLKLRTVCRMLENETYNVTIKAKSSLTISRRNMYHKVESWMLALYEWHQRRTVLFLINQIWLIHVLIWHLSFYKLKITTARIQRNRKAPIFCFFITEFIFILPFSKNNTKFFINNSATISTELNWKVSLLCRNMKL